MESMTFVPFVFGISEYFSAVKIISPLQRLFPLELLSTFGAAEVHLVGVKPRVVEHVLLRGEPAAAGVAYPRLLSSVDLRHSWSMM